MKNSNFFYWVIAIVLGSIINMGFFLFLPAIGKTTPPKKVQTIELEFLAWQKPAPQKTLPPKIIKPKPAPTPVKNKAPKPPKIKPKAIPKPEPRPVLSEIIISEKIKPKEKITKEPLQKIQQPTSKITPTKTENSETKLPTPIPIFKLTTLPRMLHRETPVYPPAMKQEGKEATVKLSVLLDAKGLVRKVSIIKPAGVEFDRAAINAIKNSTFMPANINGKPVAVLMKIPVKFRLR